MWDVIGVPSNRAKAIGNRNLIVTVQAASTIRTWARKVAKLPGPSVRGPSAEPGGGIAGELRDRQPERAGAKTGLVRAGQAGARTGAELGIVLDRERGVAIVDGVHP